MKKILIAHDFPILRIGLKYIINLSDDFMFIDEAVNESGVLEKMDKKKYDLLIMDTTIQGENGINIVKKVKRVCPKCKILMMDSYSDEVFAQRAINAGVSGYLTKEDLVLNLINAIKKIFDGEIYISKTIEDKKTIKKTDISELNMRKLSDREVQVLILLGNGNTISEIGTTLSLNVKTISTYRKRILKKMNMETTADIIKYAIENNLIK